MVQRTMAAMRSTGSPALHGPHRSRGQSAWVRQDIGTMSSGGTGGDGDGSGGDGLGAAWALPDDAGGVARAGGDAGDGVAPGARRQCGSESSDASSIAPVIPR